MVEHEYQAGNQVVSWGGWLSRGRICDMWIYLWMWIFECHPAGEFLCKGSYNWTFWNNQGCPDAKLYSVCTFWSKCRSQSWLEQNPVFGEGETSNPLDPLSAQAWIQPVCPISAKLHPFHVTYAIDNVGWRNWISSTLTVFWLAMLLLLDSSLKESVQSTRGVCVFACVCLCLWCWLVNLTSQNSN